MNVGNHSPQKFFAISGKIGSGKDTLTSCLQIMTSEDSEIVSDFYDNPLSILRSYSGIIETQSRFKNVKFADDVKFIVSRLLGVTVRQLEDRNFKEKELGEDWWFYRVDNRMIPYVDTLDYPEEDKEQLAQFLEKLTPRKIFQRIATEGGREIVHPNIWVNSLFARYIQDEDGRLPNWIVSDMRFTNEFNACVKRGAVTIRVVRHKPLIEWLNDFSVDISGISDMADTIMSDSEFYHFIQEIGCEELQDLVQKLGHISETQLDETEHDYVIHNDGSVEELVNKLREIMIAEGVELTGTGVDALKINGGI